MKSRLFALLLAVFMIAACAPATETEPEADVDADAESEAMDDAAMDEEAAVDAVRAAYVEHYNLGHPDMVADLFTDDAVTLFADGGVADGREAIEANTAAAIEGNPTARIDSDAIMVMGDIAVQRGTYSVDTAPAEGDPVSFSGYYLSELQKVDGEWKLAAVISNYDSEPPAGVPAGSLPGEAPPDLVDSPVAELTAAYQERFNMGDAAAVAELYDEDAFAAFANSPASEGRAQIEAALQERLAEGSPQLTIHEVAVEDMGDGWYVAGGWYEIAAGDASQGGNWISVIRTAEDGSQRLHWAVTNARPGGIDMGDDM